MDVVGALEVLETEELAGERSDGEGAHEGAVQRIAVEIEEADSHKQTAKGARGEGRCDMEAARKAIPFQEQDNSCGE